MTSLIRGRFYEYLARNDGLHLMSHPYKMYAESNRKAGQAFEVFNSEEYLLKMIIGSAFLESTPERRVQTWADNVDKARRAISLRAIALPNTVLEVDAENRAAEAAKIIGIKSLSTMMHRVLDGIVGIGLGTLLSVTISPWGLLGGPALQIAYRLTAVSREEKKSE